MCSDAVVQGVSTLDSFTQICPQFSREYFTVQHSIYHVGFPLFTDNSRFTFLMFIAPSSLMADNMAASNARICGSHDDCVFGTEIDVEKTSYEKIVILISIKYEAV